ncbi:MAG: glutaminyl-peptide cyclotransferase [Gammaproteobacteria bacterium]
MPTTASAGGPAAPTPSAPRVQVKWLAACAFAAVAVGAAAWAQLHGRSAPPLAGFKVVAVYPHDPNAFTQGLAIAGGQLYEGTGLYGQSTIRKVDLATGRVEKQRPINAAYFGEGIAILDGHLYQLTWQHGIGIVYDLATFTQQRTFQYTGEGWGLTQDGKQLILSDGSAKLRFLDPQTFAVVREIEVRDRGQPVMKLNELEYIDGEIWSNVWYDDRIARISPTTGEVLGWIDLAALYPKNARSSEAVLNGIAYDAAAKRLFVTGKNWPQLYEIEVARQ